jgi:hypothetical protein
MREESVSSDRREIPRGHRSPDSAERAERILDAIYDDVHSRLNPNDEECWHCGGEGETYDCIDGCCVDAESGCPDCARPCLECAIHARNIDQAVQVEVLKSVDVDLAIAFLKRQRKWLESFTTQSILANLHAGRVSHHKEFTIDEREASACWVEGLL